MTSVTLPHAGLRAVTRAVETPDDLLDRLGPDGFFWHHDALTLATAGAAAWVAPHRVATVLATIEHDDRVGGPGTGPIACGGLPFAATGGGRLLVPARVTGRHRDGRAWVTEIASAPPGASRVAAAPDRVEVVARTDPTRWRETVRRALDAIERGEVEKLVLAREVAVEADRAFDRRRLLDHLRRRQPGCFVYGAAGLVGASPELLVRRLGTLVESRPMAGTVVGEGAAPAARLAASTKDAHEHRLVVEAIAATLEPACDHLDVADRPRVEAFTSLAHLATPVRGRLRRPAPTALELALALHPTPAVAGTPRDAALALIAALEGFDRGCYAAPVGWVDAHGDGELAVALRGAELHGTTAVLRAGAGIVAGSDPDEEWAETEAKLEPMLDALGAR